MIYQALYDLAQREQLVDDPAFEPAPVAYLIKLGRRGEYLGYSAPRIEPLVDKKGKPKGRAKPPVRPVPRRSDRTVQDQAEFLVDKAEYVFGIDPTGKRAPSKLAIRKQLFRDQVAAALIAVPCNALRAVVDFLDQPIPGELETVIAPAKESEKGERAGELFAFVYEPDGGTQAVHDEPPIRTWFAQRFAATEASVRGQCLVTGLEDVPLTRLHAKPKNIPPKSKTKGGVPLTSVNSDAFKSYLMDEVQCAPISRKANIAVETALNRLLDPTYKKPDGTTCPPRSVVISSDTAFLFWSRDDSALDFLLQLDRQTPEHIAQLLRSPFERRHAPLDDPSAFYALMLSGAQGRAIVRSFITSTVEGVARAVDRYRVEVKIVRPFGEPPGSFSLLDYRRALVPRRDLDLLPPALATDLYLSIILGRPFAQSILQAIVRRNRAELLPKLENSDRRDDLLLATRCSLLKAWLIRNRKENLAVSLDRQRTDPPYRLGRLLAVIDRLQQTALGDNINATLVDRYYGSASSTPEAVFPTLLRRSQHHMGKLRREKPGLAVNTEKLLEEIVADLPRFPKTMTLEEQGLFALGFYHQRQDFFPRKETEEN
ncbi:MAG TPA: type I-C CRISPR-associated protein Cas8c/Csd1 [Thermoanaerobaculia bacterium]|nr:type I-C CRISPR-associated protein Cas8c/Csd1 [Thermoanaerobaculia bacterium]